MLKVGPIINHDNFNISGVESRNKNFLNQILKTKQIVITVRRIFKRQILIKKQLINYANRLNLLNKQEIEDAHSPTTSLSVLRTNQASGPLEHIETEIYIRVGFVQNGGFSLSEEKGVGKRCE